MSDTQLLEKDLEAEPHQQFARWLRDAADADEALPNAMTLATASRDGAPSARLVLIDAFDARGFVFQTNLDSPKAHDLADNPRAAGTFFWSRLLRQVRVSGTISPVPRQEVGALFDALPEGIRVMIRACRQGEVIPDRSTLEQTFAAALAMPDRSLPDQWGGFRVHPEWIEFFQARDNWLQDRLRYTRLPNGTWRIDRLVP